MPQVIATVDAATDDGWWSVAGDFFHNTSDLELGCQGFLGIVLGRFHTFLRYALAVPRGAIISSATVRLKSISQFAGEVCRVRISANAADNPAAVASAADGDARVLTAANVDWTVPVFPFAEDLLTDTPDLAALLQEIVDRPGWAEGQAVLLLLKDNASTIGAHRRVLSVDGGYASPLTVSYVVPEPTDWSTLPLRHSVATLPKRRFAVTLPLRHSVASLPKRP